MTGEQTAAATAATVHGFSAGFMLDPATYAFGSEQGFGGFDFYFGGRAGVLGDVEADIVTAALVFFKPEVVATNWASSGAVMARRKAAEVFAGCAGTWADGHLGDDVDWARLAELAGRVVDAASPKAAPIFAGWRSLPVPSDPKHAAVHQLNGLRELRMSRHAAAIVACGVDPGEAVRHNQPHMAFFFGWTEDTPIATELAARWNQAEAMTNYASDADYAVLSDSEAAEFVTLCTAATAAVT
jgi:hypothetical protein